MNLLECSNPNCTSHDPEEYDAPVFKIYVEVDADCALREHPHKVEPERFVCVYCGAWAAAPSTVGLALGQCFDAWAADLLSRALYERNRRPTKGLTDD